MRKIEEAIHLAIKAHKGQVDKSGLPYILHPIRVMESVNTEEEKIVAILHDVVEDTDVKIEEIYSKFGDFIGDQVAAITKKRNEKYIDYLDRLRMTEVAFQVKLADMADNSKPERLEYLPIEKQLRLVGKYTRGRHYLLTGEWYENKDLDRLIKAAYRRG